MTKLIVSILLMLPLILSIFTLIIYKIITSPLEIIASTATPIILFTLFIVGLCIFADWETKRNDNG